MPRAHGRAGAARASQDAEPGGENPAGTATNACAPEWGKTPKAAIRTKKGRQAVIELLKEFEIHEARKAQREGGETFDFGFLWKRLGLEKER